MNLLQKNLKQLKCLELGDSLNDNSASYQRILGQTMAKIDLEQISFNLPQLTPFTTALNSLFTKRIELNRQSSLRSFKLNGAEISDKCVELLCSNFRQLHHFHLSHSTYFAKENFLLTQRIYPHIAGLKELRSLTINGLNLDDHFLALILSNCRRLTEIDLANCRLITSNSLTELRLYAEQVDHKCIRVFLWGTGIDLRQLDDRYPFTHPSNLRISFEPPQESLMDFDIIEDDFEFL